VAGPSVGGLTGLADRYATALFELAIERNALEEIERDLTAIDRLLGESEDLRRAVRSLTLSRAEQGKAMDAVLERLGASQYVRNFVALLARNRRIFLIDAMIKAFRTKLAEHRGEVSAEVTSATPLKANHLQAVKDALREIVGRDVALETQVDPSLIGGLIVRVGSRMVDNSIRTKLQNLELAMKGI
jgi:F-type H+-transporting ATPase subunit delta